MNRDTRACQPKRSVLHGRGISAAGSGRYFACALLLILLCHLPLPRTCAADSPFTLVSLTNQLWTFNDSGTNLGTAWKEPGFADSGWPLGRGIFAREQNGPFLALTNTILRLTNTLGAATNFYFRTYFTLTNDPHEVTLVASNLIDDGAVVYLNGQEIYRINMPAGPVDATTLASGSAIEGAFIVTTIPSGALVIGDNLLAVEVHQVNATSPDAVMGLQIDAVPIAVSALAFTGSFTNMIVEEGKRCELAAPVQGAPVWFQWYQDDVAIPNGTTNPLVLSGVTSNSAGLYSIVITNSVSARNVTVAQVTVVPDTNPPVLVDADGTLSSTNVLITFSEPIRPNEATNLSNYRITNTTYGAALTIFGAVIVDETNVLLTTDLQNTNWNYIAAVSNIRDTSPRQNVIVPNSSMPIAFALPEVIKLVDQTYRFIDPSYYSMFDPFQPDQGTAWREMNFNTDDYPNNYWNAGTSPFFLSFEDTDYETPFTQLSPLETQLEMSDKITAYFRTTFKNNASPGGARIFLRHFVDDGAVFYLNGAEVLRFNMPDGPVNYLTPAMPSVGLGRLTDPVPLSGPLLKGTNLLAVELHHWSTFDPDKVFAAEVNIRARSLITGPVVITGGPADQWVDERGSATFEVMQAAGETFQWMCNGTNLIGETNPVLAIPAAPLVMNGSSIRVRVANSSNTVYSTNATLHVRADTNAPVPVGAWLNPDGTLTVSFNEPVSPATATNISNYSVTNKLGQTLAVISASLTNGTNVILTFFNPSFAPITVTVNNVRDASPAGNWMTWPRIVCAGFHGVVQPLAGVWQYQDSGTDLGASWIALGYDASSWKTGQALLGTNRTDSPLLLEPLRTTLALSNASNTAQVRTYYFRKAFNAIAGSNAIVTLRAMANDGCVVYLNGLEIFRLGMPSTPVSYNTLANRQVRGSCIEGPFTIPVTNLVNGTNVLAVEVHQGSATSPDVYWAGGIGITVPSLVLPVIIWDDFCSAIPWNYPVLHSCRAGTNLILSWTNPITNGGPYCIWGYRRATFMLQHACEWKVAAITDPMLNWPQHSGPPTNEWYDVTTNTPVVIPATNDMRFYRLKLLP